MIYFCARTCVCVWCAVILTPLLKYVSKTFKPKSLLFSSGASWYSACRGGGSRAISITLKIHTPLLSLSPLVYSSLSLWSLTPSLCHVHWFKVSLSLSLSLFLSLCVSPVLHPVLHTDGEALAGGCRSVLQSLEGAVIWPVINHHFAGFWSSKYPLMAYLLWNYVNKWYSALGGWDWSKKYWVWFFPSGGCFRVN